MSFKRYANLIILGAPIWLVMYFYIPLQIRKFIDNLVWFRIFFVLYIVTTFSIVYVLWGRRKR